MEYSETLCKAYSNPIYLRFGQHSRNAHCRLCKTAVRNNTDIHSIRPSFGGNLVPDLPIIFNFSSKSYTLRNGRDGQDSFTIKTLSCETNQVYDPFTQACRRSIATLRNNFLNITNKNICSPNILLNESEFRSLPNGSVYVLKHNRLYGNAEYFVIDNIKLLCTNFTRSYTEKSTQQAPRKFESQEELALEFITYTGGGLSVLGLSILLAVYSWLSELRNSET